MLVGGSLGFPYLVLVVVLFVPVIGFVVRRKWRLAASRREEIKRLLVLASEEAVRAEVEATAGYCATPVSISSKPQYQCAVCFCPTTTRCAKCKAVRYCSGKCQIIHWRQGHKDECRPYITIHPVNDAGSSSDCKVSKQEDNEDYGDSLETEGNQPAKLAGRFLEKPVFSSSSHFVGLHCKDEVGVECLAHCEGTDSTFKSTFYSLHEGSSASSTFSDSSVDASTSSSKDSDRPGRLQSADVTPDNCEVETFPEHPALANYADSSIDSGKFNQTKSNFSDGYTQSGSLSSPGWTVVGSNESSSSEPSTLSSGFWEGTIHSKKSSIDALDATERSSSSEAANGNMPNSLSSLCFSFDLAKISVHGINLEGSNANSIVSDEAATTLEIRKPSDEAFSSVVRKDGLKSRRSSSSISDASKHMDVDSGSDSRKSTSREVKCFPLGSACANPASTAGGHSTNKGAKILSSLPSSFPEGSNHVFNNKSITSHTSESPEVRSLLSKTSDAHSSSCTRRHLAQSTKSVKVDDGIHGVAACSSQFAGNLQNATNGLKTSMSKVVDQIKPSKLSRHYPLGTGSEMAGRYGCKGFFPYELFVKLYNWKKVELHPCGLINCGNSCYANAVLQCLTFTPPLTAYLLQGLHSKACEKKEWCFTCEFESLVLKAKDGNSPLSPIRILSGSHLGIGREEDAHEFLRYAIDTLQTVCLKEAGADALGSLEEQTTLVGLTFGGYLRSKIKCMKCGGKSERHERMMDLTVEIEGNIETLEEALNKFTCTEILDGENKYKCSRCKSYEKAKKKLTVLEAPNVLTIALKRFQFGKFGKLNKSIHFPEILDLAPYVSGTSDKSPIYRLYGVVVHIDTMNAAFSGHYVCYVKNIQNKWFMIDDSTVKGVELHSVLTKGAYMLLYSRCSPRAPRSIRQSLITSDPRKQKIPTFKSRSHSTEPWDGSMSDPSLNDHLSSQPQVHQNLEEDSSSDNSSGLFSESCSCSTESSNRDSSTSSNDDFFDHILSDLDRDWNSSSSSWRNLSDSDTSSSSSFPSPLYSRHSPLADLNRYASRYPETSGSQIDHVEESGTFGHGLWSRARSRSCKEAESSPSFLYSDMMNEECRKLDCSNSCRETNSDRLRWVNPLENAKHGATFRRSTMRGRSD